MKENFEDYLYGGVRLNEAILKSERVLLPMEIYSLQYVEQTAERRRLTFTPYMHQHTYFEMHTLIAGTQIYQFDEEKIMLHPNEVVIFSPNTLHAIPYSSDDLRKFSVGFTFLDGQEEEEFAWVVGEMRSKPCIKADANRWYVALFQRIFHEARKEGRGWTQVVLNLFAQLIIGIVRDMMPKEKSTGASHSFQRKRIESIERFILDNISAPINKQMVAQQMYLSVRQLDRVTLNERGMTLKMLIDDIKIGEARRLLKETDMRQKEIASTLGFTEVSSFSRFFHRFEHISPGDYRRRYVALQGPSRAEAYDQHCEGGREL